MKRVAIVGHGYVGRSIEDLFRSKFEISIYDTEHQTQFHQVLGADIAFVCVPTPEGVNGEADISAVATSVAMLDAPLIVIKSTVPPGTCETLNLKYGKAVHYSPEYVVERNPVETPKGWCIVGGPRASEVLEYFQQVLPSSTRFIATGSTEAELSKYMDNAYFATKVTFCNEFAEIADHFGVDYKVVRDLWLNDPRIEPDHTVVFDGDPGFGGKCLPKDLSAIIHRAELAGYDPALLKAVREKNKVFRNGPKFQGW